MALRNGIALGRRLALVAAAGMAGACSPARPAAPPVAPVAAACVRADAPVDTAGRDFRFEFQTARPAQVLEDGFRSRPGAVAGEILVQFVVDTAGTVDARTLKVLHGGDLRLAAQVRALLPELRFRPAELAPGCPVRQLVQHPFRFH